MTLQDRIRQSCDLCSGAAGGVAYPVACFELGRTPTPWIKWLCPSCARASLKGSLRSSDDLAPKVDRRGREERETAGVPSWPAVSAATREAA